MPPVPTSRHADHDRLLVAAYAAGDATGADLETAQAQVATCADCAALHRDLRAIAGALPALPAPVRSRDFRLTPEQAAALRPSAWRRLLEPFAGPRFAFAGPLGTGLATLGIAGLLVAGSLGTPLAASAPSAGGAPVPEAAGAPVDGPGAGSAASEAPAFAAPAPSAAPSTRAETAPDLLQAPQPSARLGGDSGNTTEDLRSPGGEAPDGVPEASSIDGAAKAAEAPLAPAQPSSLPLLLLAGLLLGSGIGLGGLRLAARRLT